MEGYMRVYQVIKIDKNGRRWTSPNLSSLSVVEKVASAYEGERTLVKELCLEKTGIEAARKYAMATLFPSEQNALQNRSSSVYVLGDEVYEQRKEELETLREEVSTFYATSPDNSGKKKIYYIGYQNTDGSVSEIYATADDYLKARDVAVEFSKMMQRKKMAIVETDVYFDAEKCIYDINHSIFDSPKERAVWILGTAQEESHYEMAKALADLKKKHKRVVKRNEQLEDDCDRLKKTIQDWDDYAGSLANQVIDEKQRRVIAEHLLETKKHPFKNLFGGKSK